MANTGKCPYCQEIIQEVKVEEVDISDSSQDKRQGFSYQCPACSTVLGVQMNPIILNEQLKKDILEELPGAIPQIG